jgi:O-antigen ligase
MYFYIPALVGGLLLLAQRNWLSRALALPGVLTLALTIGVLRSRSLWVGAVVGLSAIFLIRSRRRWRGVAAAALLVAGLALSYLEGWLPFAIEERITAMLAPGEAIDLVYRQEVVRVLWSDFERSPFVGFGLGQSWTLLPAHLVQGKVDAVHNIVIHALYETGLVGALGVLSLPLVAVRAWRRARRLGGADDRWVADWALASFVGMYAAVQFTPTMYDHTAFLLLALLAATADAPVRDAPGSPGVVPTSPREPLAPPRREHLVSVTAAPPRAVRSGIESCASRRDRASRLCHTRSVCSPGDVGWSSNTTAPL